MYKKIIATIITFGMALLCLLAPAIAFQEPVYCPNNTECKFVFQTRDATGLTILPLADCNIFFYYEDSSLLTSGNMTNSSRAFHNYTFIPTEEGTFFWDVECNYTTMVGAASGIVIVTESMNETIHEINKSIHGMNDTIISIETTVGETKTVVDNIEDTVDKIPGISTATATISNQLYQMGFGWSQSVVIGLAILGLIGLSSITTGIYIVSLLRKPTEKEEEKEELSLF